MYHVACASWQTCYPIPLLERHNTNPSIPRQARGRVVLSDAQPDAFEVPPVGVAPDVKVHRVSFASSPLAHLALRRFYPPHFAGPRPVRISCATPVTFSVLLSGNVLPAAAAPMAREVARCPLVERFAPGSCWAFSHSCLFVAPSHFRSMQRFDLLCEVQLIAKYCVFVCCCY